MKKSELTIDVIRWLIAVVVSIALIFASTTAYNAFKPAEPDEVLTGAAQGMLSEITVSVAMKDGVIMSAEATEGGETPELGGVAIEHYNTDYLPTLVGKAIADVDPSAIDTVSGATITSNAFIAALKQALGIEEVAPVEEPAPAEDTAPAVVGGTLSATAKGMGDVTVTLTVSDGVITSASIEGANETAGLGADVIANANEGFMADLVGKTLADVDPASFDVVSGSTLTSNAIIEALGQIVGTEAAPVEETASAEETPTEETSAAEEPAPTAEGETLSATAKGMGDVTVTLTVSDGVITSASIEGANETAGLGADVIANANEGFMADLVGKTLADVDPASFDVVSGSTLTSNAIIEALGQIVGTEAAPAEETATAEEAAPAAEETLSATAKGMGDVTVTLTVSDGVITAASIEGANETPGLGADLIANANEGFMADLVGKTLADVDPASFDVVSGSTLTSNAIIDALGQIVGTEAAPAEETVTAEETPAEEAAPAAEETLSATAKGMGDVTVTLTVSDGVITAASIEGANETPGLGADLIANANEGFMADLVGKTLADVDPASFDVVSGCTVTSNAIIDALGQIVGK